MKKTLKFFVLILVFALMIFLPGCEASLENLNDQYEVGNKVKGEMLSDEKLKTELEDCVSNYGALKCGEILIEGEVEDGKVNKVYMKLQYDLSGDKLEDFKMYIKVKALDVNGEAFIKDGYMYVNAKMGETSQKIKFSLKEMIGDYNLEEIKEEILEEFTSILDLEIIGEDFMVETKDMILEYLESEDATVKAVIDSDDNFVIDFSDKIAKISGRIVFNEDNKLIYVGAKEEGNYMGVSFSYDKPKFDFPSTSGYDTLDETYYD